VRHFSYSLVVIWQVPGGSVAERAIECEPKCPHTIYCDESGFTGTHLSDAEQPFFVYTSVAIAADEANAIVNEGRSQFRVQAPEVKGGAFLKTPKGRKAISFFLEKCLQKSKCVVMHKKYALACKLFEYIFEPALSEDSFIFYHLGFNRFVSTLLYAESITKDRSNDLLFERFERLLQSQAPEAIESFFEQRPTKRTTRSIAKEVVTFAHAQRAAIVEELETIRGLGHTGKWTLDVTDAALYSLLCYWGERFAQLDVFCDESKPLASYVRERGLFSVMVGRVDKQSFAFPGDEPKQVTFNLARPISLVRSQDYSGVQIADVISAAVSYSFRNPEESESREWLKMVQECSALHEQSILPSLEEVNFDNRRVALKAALFKELVRRSRCGEELLANIREFLSFPYPPRRQKRSFR
jgi:hypothetical protein